MQRALLAVSKRAGEFDNAALAAGQKLLAGKFRRSPEVATLSCARSRNWSKFQLLLATPITGTFNRPRLISDCSEGKIFL